jgi:hypothetical protein
VKIEYVVEKYSDPEETGAAAFIRSGGEEARHDLRILAEVDKIEDAELICKLLNEYFNRG